MEALDLEKVTVIALRADNDVLTENVADIQERIAVVRVFAYVLDTGLYTSQPSLSGINHTHTHTLSLSHTHTATIAE